MKLRTIITVVLLVIVAASVVALVVKEANRPGGSQGTSAVAAPAEKDGVVAFYFHRNMRCATCNQMEAFTREAVEGGFAEAIKDGRLRFKVVNIETPGNEHFVDELKVASNGPYLAEYVGGRPVRSKYLDAVWNLYGDRATFSQYVQAELTAFMAGGKVGE
jgi:hypothetical protein